MRFRKRVSHLRLASLALMIFPVPDRTVSSGPDYPSIVLEAEDGNVQCNVRVFFKT